MPLDEDRISVVVADTSVLINLIHVKFLDILGRLPGYDFVVPEQVVAEVTDPPQAAALRLALEQRLLRVEVVDDVATLTLFVGLISIMGRGEAACLSLAQSRGWLVAWDERRVFRREAIARLGPGPLLNTPGLFVLAIRAGLLSIAEADRAKQFLESRRFQMAFISFADILGCE